MTSKQAQVVFIPLMPLTNWSLHVRILYVTIKLEKAWNIKTSLLVGKDSEKRAKEWLFMNPWQPATMNNSVLALLFSGLVIFFSPEGVLPTQEELGWRHV